MSLNGSNVVSSTANSLFTFQVLYTSVVCLPLHLMTDESLNSWKRINECSKYEECVQALCCTLTVSLGILWLLASLSGQSASTQ